MDRAERARLRWEKSTSDMGFAIGLILVPELIAWERREPYMARQSEEPAKGGANVHYLPWRVNFNAEAKVGEYFESTRAKTSGENGQEVAYFRGRHLLGKEMVLLDDYTGLLFETVNGPRGISDDIEKDEAESESLRQCKALNCVDTFSKVMMWGHGVEPDVDTPAVKAISEWIQVMELVSINWSRLLTLDSQLVEAHFEGTCGGVLPLAALGS